MYQHPHFYHVTNEYLLLKKIAYFMISEFWTFGLHNLFVRTPETLFSNLRTFGLKNLRTREPSNLRTFGLIGCNQHGRVQYQRSSTTSIGLLRCLGTANIDAGARKRSTDVSLRKLSFARLFLITIHSVHLSRLSLVRNLYLCC